MAKIHIENGIISSSADYSLYHGTSPLATVEPGGFRVQGDIIAENMIVSSSTTYVTTSFSSGNTRFGDDSDDTHQFTGSLEITGGINVNQGKVLGKLEDNSGFKSTSGLNTFTDGGTQFALMGSGTQIGVAGDQNDMNFKVVDGFYVSTNNNNEANLTILSNGKVGIGTESPQKLLHLHQANSNTLFEAVHIRTNSSGEGLALGVNADNSSYVVNSDSSNALHLGGASSTINGTGHLTVAGGGNIGIGTASPGSLLTIKDTGDISTATFISGITGDGFRIKDNGSDGVSMEIDNIIVRNTLRTHIFQKDVVKATNGILFISDSGVISGSSNSAGTVTFDNTKSATFNDNDILFFKDAQDDGTINAVRFQINGSKSTSGDFDTYNVDNVLGDLDNLNMGGTAARINGGTITIDASSNNSPFIDVNASSGSAVLRMGNLAGITSPVFGSLSGKGFGIWASGSAYFEGKINATTGGVIAGWDLNANSIEKVDSNGGVKIDSTNKRIDFLSNASTTRLRVGQVDSNKFGIRGFDDNAERVFEISETRNEIAGWDITPGNIQSDNTGGSVALSATSQSLQIFTGSIDFARPKVVVGDLPTSGDASTKRYGFGVFTGTVDADITADNTYNVLITRDKAKLAGWDLIPGNIQSDNTFGSVRFSSISQSLAIWTGSINDEEPKLVLGKLPINDGTVQNPYGLAVFSGTGTVTSTANADSASVLITANKARLAGWELVPGRLSSGTVAKIDGNNATIALGTNATTHTSATPQPSLFFVSASADPIFFVGENFSYVNDVLTAGGWKIGNNVISSSTSADTDGVIIDSEAKVLTFHGANGKDNFSHGSATRNNVRLAVGQVDAGAFGMRGFDNSGNRVFEISETRNEIAGFSFTRNELIGSTSGTEQFRIDLGSANIVDPDDDPVFAITLGGDASSDFGLGGNTIPIQMGHGTTTGRTIFRVGDATNFLKFDSSGTFTLQNSGTTTLSGSAVNITTPKFFFGSEDSQFISGSNGNIRISSSLFQLDPANNVVNISGSITATDGVIGGFTIDSASLIREAPFQADPGGAFVTASIQMRTGTEIGLPIFQLGFRSGSTGAGIRMGSKSDGAELRLGHMTDGVVRRKIYMTAFSGSGGASAAIQTNQMSYGGGETGFIFSTSDSTGDRFQVGSVLGPHIQFSSQDDRLFISSSNFFLGGGGQFISGSSGNIEVSSSKFHLKPDGSVVVRGEITAESGDIGGFSLEDDKIINKTVSGTSQTTSSLHSGVLAGYENITKNTATNRKMTRSIFSAAGAKNTETWEYRADDTLSSNHEFKTTVTAGQFSPPGQTWEWAHKDPYDDLEALFESITIENLSGSFNSTDRGLKLKYNTGIGASLQEKLVIGCIDRKDVNHLAPSGFAPVYYGISGSNDFTASFGRIISSQTVGIGTTSPGKTLDVVGEGRFSGDVTIGSGGTTPDLIFSEGDSQITGPLNANFLIKSRGNGTDEGVSIQGADSAGLHVNKAGLIGIGTSSPVAPLHINTTANAITSTSVDVSNLQFKILNPANDTDEAVGMGFALSTDNENIGAAIIHNRQGSESYGSLHFATKANGDAGGADIPIKMSLSPDGYLGIGTTNPQVGLDIHTDTTETVAVFGQADDGNAYIATRVGEVQNQVSGYIFQVGSTAAVGYGSANTTATIVSQVKNDGGALQGNLIFSTNGGDSLSQEMIIEADGDITMAHDLDVSGDLTAATITMTGKIDTSGEVEAEHLHTTDDVEVGHAIYHSGDTDTAIIFTTDAIEFEAGAVEFFRIVEGTNDNFVVNEGSADVNFRVESNNKTTMFKVDAGLDKIGINEGTPAAALHIQQTSDNDDGGIRLYNVQDGNYFSIRVNTSEYLYFQYNGTSNGGHIRNNSDVGQITFTGQHRSSPSTGTVNNYTSSIGYIVCADGTYDNLWDNNDEEKQDTRPNINESIPRVKLSNKSKDKTVFGVISECEVITEQTTTSESIELIDDPTDPDTKIRTVTSSSAYVREYTQGVFTTVMEASSSADQKLIINSLGEGAVWVCNISGSIENGDYITTSPIEGLGMKQDDDLLHNYTVAKITQDCTFDLTASASYDCVEFNWSGSIYKKAFVGCTYHCG